MPWTDVPDWHSQTSSPVIGVTRRWSTAVWGLLEHDGLNEPLLAAFA